MKKGIIFDMDGTLWDSSLQVCKAWDLAIEKCGYSRAPITIEEMQGVMGKTMDQIAEILFPFVQGKEQEKLLAACCKVENDYLRKHGAKLYDGVEEMFATLQKDYFLAIVSNCQSGYIEAFLEHYGFGKYIDDIQCFGMNQLPKGENIRLVVERNHLEKAVYVGDIQGDYEASMQAGVDFIHAAYGFGEIVEKVPRIQKLEELPQVVAELLK